MIFSYASSSSAGNVVKTATQHTRPNNGEFSLSKRIFGRNCWFKIQTIWIMIFVCGLLSRCVPWHGNTGKSAGDLSKSYLFVRVIKWSYFYNCLSICGLLLVKSGVFIDNALWRMLGSATQSSNYFEVVIAMRMCDCQAINIFITLWIWRNVQATLWAKVSKEIKCIAHDLLGKMKNGGWLVDAIVWWALLFRIIDANAKS